MEKILIIGGVAAGATVAAKVRRISPTAEIVMLEARSAYAQRVLMQLGFTNTKNGGGIIQMMMQR